MPSRGRTAVFAGTLMFTMMASAFQIFAFAILASRLITDLDISRTEIGIIGSINTFVGAATAPLTGRLTDRIGARRSVVALLVVSAVAMGVMAISPNVWILGLSAFVGGVPQGWGNPATNTVISTRVSEGNRGSITGLKQSGVTLGVFLSGLALPGLASALGWRGASWAFAALFIVLAIAVQLTLEPDPPQRSDQSAAERAAESRARLPPAVWRVAAFALLMGTAGGAASRFFPLFAEESIGLSNAVAGFIVAGGGLLGMLARVVVGRLAEQRYQPHRLMRVLALVGTTYLVLLTVVDESTAWLLILAPILSAVGIAAWNAVAMLAVIVNVSSTQSGRASGVVMMGFLGGLTISAPIAGLVVDTWNDYRIVWMAAIGLTLVAATTIGRTPAAKRS